MCDTKSAAWRAPYNESWHRDWHPWPSNADADIQKVARPRPQEGPDRHDRSPRGPDGGTAGTPVERATDDFMKQYARLGELSQWQTLRVSQVKLEMDLATGFAQLVKGMGSDIKGLSQ